MDIAVFRVLVMALLIGFIAHRGFYTRKVQHSTESVLEQPKAGRSTQLANYLALPALLATVIYIVNPTWMSWSALSLPAWLRWLGVTIALGGFVLLQWSQQTLGKNWSDTPKLLKDQKLVITGPYRWIRHPIYAVFLLILGSLLLISANWFVGGMWLAMTSLDIASRARIEEAMMIGQFGEQYRVYMRETGRLFPRLVKRESTRYLHKSKS
jgi:protein-S-isoprenylcysteine O-methyltransferase Ste14